MADYTKLNLRTDVEDAAKQHGMDGLESHFARKALGLQNSGVSLFRLTPSFRMPFGHRHGEQEEVYVLLSGSARIKVDDDVVDLAPLDAIRVPGSVTRALEAGPDGAEVLAIGAPATQGDAEMEMGWWTD